MRKASVKYRILTLFVSNAVLQLMGFAYRMALSRNCPASALGLNSLVMQVYGMIVSVCITGLNVAVSATAARVGEKQIKGLARSSLSAFSVLWLLMALPVFLLRGAIADNALGDGSSSGILVLMLICIFMTGIENVLKSIHLGTKYVGRCAVSELCEQAVRFLLVILLLKSSDRDTDSSAAMLIMLGMTFSEFVSVGFLTVSFFGLFGKTDGRRFYPIRDIADIAFPATLTSVASTVFASVGSLLLPSALISFGSTRSEALSAIGILNTVYIPITMLPMAFIGAAASVVMPEISETVSRGRDPSRLIVKTFLSVAAVGAASSFLLLLFSASVIKSLFGQETDGTLFFLLMLKAVVIFFQVISAAVLNGLMKQRTVLLFAVLGEAYQLALILLLSPVLGIYGCALGMISGELLRLVCNILSIRRSIFVPDSALTINPRSFKNLWQKE